MKLKTLLPVISNNAHIIVSHNWNDTQVYADGSYSAVLPLLEQYGEWIVLKIAPGIAVLRIFISEPKEA